MQVQIVPRKIRTNYCTSYDICCVGFDYVINFPTYKDAKKFCETNGFSIYNSKSKNQSKKCTCKIYKNNRIIWDSEDRW
jgi:hypothetical protein